MFFESTWDVGPRLRNAISGIISLHKLNIQDILEDGSNVSRHTIVLKLIQSWVSQFESQQITSCLDDVSTLNAENVIKIVHLMQCEREFCEVILLLPEKTKSYMITEICCKKTLNPGHSCNLREILFVQACGCYTRNIIFKIRNISKSVIKMYFKNISDIFSGAANVMFNHIHVISSFLDKILGIDEYDVSGVDSFSVLDKTSKEHMQGVLKLVKSNLKEDSQSITRLGIITIQELLVVEGYQSFLSGIFHSLSQSCSNLENLSQSNAKLICAIIVKLERLCTIFSSDPRISESLITSTISLKTTLTLTLALEQFALCETFKKINLNNSIISSTEGGLLISRWRLEEDKHTKFVIALRCLTCLFSGSDEILSWLFSYDSLDLSEADTFISHLNGYLLNFGSPDLLERIIRLVHQRQNTDGSKHLTDALKQVVIQGVSFLTLKNTNNLLMMCGGCLRGESSLFFSRKYTEEQFQFSLKDVFNKLTCESSDERILLRLSHLMIIFPFRVAQEIMGRIFADRLNHSVLINITKKLSALFILDLDCDEKDEKNMILFHTKSAYNSNKEKPSAPANILGVISILIQNVPDQLKASIYHFICDAFVIHNLDGEKQNAFLSCDVTLEIMNKLLEPENIETMCTDYSFIILNLLLGSLNRNKIALHLLESVNNIIQLLISSSSTKVNEKDLIIAKVCEMITEYGWCSAYYFFSLFSSMSVSFCFNAPQCLIDFCNIVDENQFCSLSKLYKVVDDDDDDDDEAKWDYLFQIAYLSPEAVLFLIQHISPFDVESEMPNIIQSVARTLQQTLSVGRAKSIIKCFEHLVAKQKILKITEYLKEELLEYSNHHGYCFAMLIIIQSFILCFDETENLSSSLISNKILEFLKIFHLFLQYAKKIEDLHACSYFLLYLFEQLVFSVSLLSDFVKNKLTLLLMDIFKALMECINGASCDLQDVLKEECKNILNNAEGDFTLLREQCINL